MVNFKEHILADREALLNQLCSDTIDSLSTGIKTRGAASMLLSGGSSPGALYEKISNQDLDWENVYFAPTDERWVDPEHIDSNERLIRETLIKNKAARANYVGLKSNDEDPIVGQYVLESIVKKIPFPTDVVLLGMGEDGHIASLFPGLLDTEKAMDLDNKNMCHAINRGNGEVPRMTMTLNCLMKTKKIFLLFYGSKKLGVFNKAKTDKTDHLPVSYLLHQNKIPISLYWAE